MTILDANILLYAYDADSPHHDAVRSFLDSLFAAPEIIGIPWVSLWAFVRISTNPRLTQSPLATEHALEIVRELISQPNVSPVEPGARHLALLQKLVVRHRVHGPQLTDAVLAALAIEHGASLASTDRGFAKFSEFRWTDPLAS